MFNSSTVDLLNAYEYGRASKAGRARVFPGILFLLVLGAVLDVQEL